MLNQYLNAHLELFENGFRLCDLTVNLPQWKGHPDLPEPFLRSSDASRPSDWRLAPLDFIYLDAPALAALGTSFLTDLPNLRELYIYAPGLVLELNFLNELPELSFLQLYCESVTDQAPLLSLQELKETILEFKKPDLKALRALPKLNFAYFNPAGSVEVREFLEHRPDCEVDFAFDEEYAPRFRTTKIGEQYLRYFDYVHDKEKDILELYIEPLPPYYEYQNEPPSEAQLREFRQAYHLLVEQLVQDYQREDNLLTWKKENDMEETYMCSLQFQRLLTGYGPQLLEALEDFRGLAGSDFSLPKMEWWLLKYGDLNRQVIDEMADREFPPPFEDDEFEYRHCAEVSFLEAFRKLHLCTGIWRHKEHWEAKAAELEQLLGQEQLQEFMSREYEKHQALWHQLKVLNLEEEKGRLELKLEGYREVVALSKEEFAAVRELAKRVFDDKMKENRVGEVVR